MVGSRRRLAVALADVAEFCEPLGPTALGVGQDAVASIPEREAAVDGLLEKEPHSGELRVGIVKSDAKTRVVLPPFVGVIVPASIRMASGSPCRLWST